MCEGKRPEPKPPTEHYSAMSPEVASPLAVHSIGSFCLCLLCVAAAMQQVWDMLPALWWHNESLSHFVQHCVCKVPLDCCRHLYTGPSHCYVESSSNNMSQHVCQLYRPSSHPVRCKTLGINIHTVGGVNPDVEHMSHRHVCICWLWIDAVRQLARAAV